MSCGLSIINFKFFEILIYNFKILGYNTGMDGGEILNAYLIEKLKEGRLNKGLKQSDVTKLTGIKNTTLSNYENGNTEPDMDTFLKLCQVYELNYTELLSEAYGYHLPGFSIDIKKSDVDLIKKFNALDSFGQQTITMMLDRELERIKIMKKSSLNTEAGKIIRPTRFMNYYQKLASAGTGEYIFDDIPIDTIEVPLNEISKKADFVIGVNGDSMEPTYYDGDKVFVERCQIVETGEIGVFMVNNECLIKEAGKDGLISHNKEYGIIPGTKDIQCIGKVLGKVDLN